MPPILPVLPPRRDDTNFGALQGPIRRPDGRRPMTSPLRRSSLSTAPHELEFADARHGNVTSAAAACGAHGRWNANVVACSRKGEGGERKQHPRMLSPSRAGTSARRWRRS
jgi:hypothetical protein